MTSKSSDNEDDSPAESAWDRLCDEASSTRIVYVVARYNKDGLQTDFEIDSEPPADIYSNYGMLVHAVEVLKDVMVNGEAVMFEFDEDDDGDTDD